MISYILTLVAVCVGFLSYGHMMNYTRNYNDWFPKIEESDFVELDPFKDWK